MTRLILEFDGDLTPLQALIEIWDLPDGFRSWPEGSKVRQIVHEDSEGSRTNIVREGHGV